MLFRRTAAFVSMTALILSLISSDSSDRVVAPKVPPRTPAPALDLTQSAPRSPIDSVAYAVALALSNDSLRAALLDDMRDSPFEDHALHLKSYLEGTRGQLFARMTRALVNLDQPHLISVLARAGQLQIWIPSYPQRSSWTSDDGNILVYGTTATLQELSTRTEYHAWAPDGREVVVPAHEPPEAILILISPVQVDFGEDPETVRAQAPKKDRNTIVPMMCDPVLGCNYPPPQPPQPPAGGLDLGINWDGCTQDYHAGESWDPATDADMDFISDNCEYLLASAFAPWMSYSSDDYDMTNEPVWIAQWECLACVPVYPRVRIMYALAYHRDKDHVGDSEFIILHIHYDQGHWYLDSATLSGHFLVPIFDQTRTYGYDALSYRSTYRGAPRIYPSSGKHANYESASHCNDVVGDHCTSPGNWGQVVTQQDRNLGEYNASYPWLMFHNCMNSWNQSLWPGYECFWKGPTTMPMTFGGWLGGSSTSYQTIFEYWGFKLAD